jgi:GNAT superfamily N-acetyltransferase
MIKYHDKITEENILPAMDLLKPLYDYKEHDFRRVVAASRVVVVTVDDGLVIGYGRAITDGLMQAAIYDVFVDSRYRKMGIGTNIVDLLCVMCGARVTILYAEPGSEPFYKKIGFKFINTAMYR